MNTGVVSVRYARALLKASIEARQETQILEEMIMLQKNLCDIPELRQIIDNPWSHPPRKLTCYNPHVVRKSAC